MKRVLIFSLAYYPKVGGAEVAIKEITDRINDIEWHMLTMRFSAADPVQERIGNVEVHRIGNRGSYLDKVLFVPRAALAAHRLNQQHRFDGSWAMMSYMLFPLVISGLRMPYVLTLQEGDSYGHMFSRVRILPFLPLLNRGFRHARVVQAISTYLGGWARARGFKGDLEIIPNGVDLKRFSGEMVAHQNFVMITTSRLVYKNAIDDVIRAMPQLPDVHFKVLGSGPDEAKLKQLAAQLGVAKRVLFMGHIDHSAMVGHLRAADIFIRPSRTEGMGNSFIEAMAAGLPVVATQEGGLSDFITPEVAWPVRRDNPGDIVHAVQNILGNRAHTTEVVERARQLAQTYDWSSIAHTMRGKVFARLFNE